MTNLERLESIIRDRAEDEAWAVLHTRPRCEKKLIREMEIHGMRAYTPLETRPHQYGSRKRENDIPIFSGYIFGLYSDRNKAWIRQNQYLANFLPAGSRQTLEQQLLQIETALACGQAAEVYNHLAEGTPVEIRSGPMKGMEGIVQKIKNNHRIILNLEMINQSIAVEIDRAWLLATSES